MIDDRVLKRPIVKTIALAMVRAAWYTLLDALTDVVHDRQQEAMCVRCGETSHDLRTLWHSCLAAMNESVSTPYVVFRDGEMRRHFYTLRVCKRCRGDWLRAIDVWYCMPPSEW